MTNQAKRTVLITGGTGGLGHVVVRRLLAEYSCVVLHRSADAFAELERVIGANERLHGIEADVSDESVVNQAVEQTQTQYGPLYGLVHLAGGFEGGSVTETSLNTWNKLIETNLTSAFIVARAVLPHLQQQGVGRIVVIGSAEVPKRPTGLAAYAVAKGGLNILIEVLAKELKDTRITANILLPGSLDTPAMREFMSPDKLVPLDRVADTIAFLLSDAAASITGASIPLTITGNA